MLAFLFFAPFFGLFTLQPKNVQKYSHNELTERRARVEQAAGRGGGLRLTANCSNGATTTITTTTVANKQIACQAAVELAATKRNNYLP